MSAGRLPKRRAEKPDWVDVLLAATLAAWGTIVVAMTLLFVAYIITGLLPGGTDRLFALMIPTIFLGFLIAIIVCVIVGLPALGLIHWLKLSRWWQWTAIGAAAGLLVSLLPGLHLPIDPISVTPVALVFLLAGAFAGDAAWQEQHRGRGRA